ncbi:hypothetical protein V6N11_047587 [Hibiscus sabdariffa]|uniref:Uncharacterized protein n=1 Tax=Hibiscus sabdariffa TaxID=183260 RepID=A0ABR2NKX9_9ROSI
MTIKVVLCDNSNDWWEDPRSCVLRMTCNISVRHDLGTGNFKFIVVGMVKDGRVGCGRVLYATSGIIRVLNWLENLCSRPWFSWPILMEIDPLLNQIGNVSFIKSGLVGGRMAYCLLLRLKLVEGSVSAMKGGERGRSCLLFCRPWVLSSILLSWIILVVMS